MILAWNKDSMHLNKILCISLSKHYIFKMSALMGWYENLIDQYLPYFSTDFDKVCLKIVFVTKTVFSDAFTF